MVIDGKTRTCGVIGNPVEHTMSPAIHNTLADLMEHNLTYVPFYVEQGALPDAIKGAFALNILGLNVTVPYKSDVMDTLVDVDAMAKQIGAVNTLVRQENGYKGYNTDMEGLYRAMTSEGIRVEQENVILLGAGGAARAVAFLCAWHQVNHIYIMNRTVPKAQAIADEVNHAMGQTIATALSLEEIDKLPQEKMLAIQATSVGLAPHEDEVVVDTDAFYERVHTGFDLIYRPLETKFMKLVKAHGGQAYHGLKMLLYQGIIAYELWNSCSVNEEQAAIVYQAMMQAMGIEA